MQKIQEFYAKWNSEMEPLLNSYIYENENLIVPRFIYSHLERYLFKFLTNQLADEEKIILLPGLRGVGKTTLLAQLFFFEKFLQKRTLKKHLKHYTLDFRFYISVDELMLRGITLAEFLDFLETNLWGSLARGQKKVLLLLDEVQYDPKWDLTLKKLYDKTVNKHNLLVVATGSAAISLKRQSSDLIRRSIILHVLPEKYTEFLNVHHGITPPTGLSDSIKEALFFQSTAEEVEKTLKELSLPLATYLISQGTRRFFEKEYLLKGAFPFSAKIKNKFEALQRIKDTIILNVERDLKTLGNFDTDTLSKVPSLLYLLAYSDSINSKNLLDSSAITSIQTLRKILDTLVDSELLFKLLPYGKVYKNIKKASKYLFIAPSLRAALLPSFETEHFKGKLLEDFCALIFAEIFKGTTTLMYDYGKNGADFIIRFHDLTEIIVEVGFTKNSIKQVYTTMKRAKSNVKYGIVIGTEKLERYDNIVTVPIEYVLAL